jgi:phospholipid/cholesterol/gamma-HCH transport system substrate-binding protein
MQQAQIAAVKVGVLTLMSLGLLIASILWLQGRGLQDGPQFSVLFHDVDSLKVGAPVQFMGIRVGFVRQVIPIVTDGRYRVKVAFSLASNEPRIPKGSHITIQQSGIVGEKFLEITPPQPKEVTVTTASESEAACRANIPLKYKYTQGFLTIGTVETVQVIGHDPFISCHLRYRVTYPGASLPSKLKFQLVSVPEAALHLENVVQAELTPRPNTGQFFTVEDPMRLKRFLEIQLESAVALKETNDKINQLMSDETIMTLNSTIKNAERLTNEATEVMKGAKSLFQKTAADLDILVASGNQLTGQITTLSQNVNHIIGDANVQQDIVQTLNALKQASSGLNTLIQDPGLKETLRLARETSTDAAQWMRSVRQTTDQLNLDARLDVALTNVNTSLDKLSTLLGNLNQLSASESDSLRAIVADTKQTADSLKRFSNRLNGRFTLFKLMF